MHTPPPARSGRSEHWKRSNPSLAHSAKAPSSPELPCERRTDPGERRRGTNPQRQPWHSATAKHVIAPGVMRRSFRTLRMCAIPGVPPRAGIGAPLGHSERPTFPEPSCASTPSPKHLVNDDCFSSTATIKPPHRGTYPQSTKRSEIGPERALERRHPDPHRAAARKPSLSPRSLPAQDRSRKATLS